jgi:hypothetical protein
MAVPPTGKPVGFPARNFMTYEYSSTGSPFATIVGLAISIICIAAQWKMFEKAGRQGWAALIPFYNVWTMFDIVYGNGNKMFLLFIPIYHIYVAIKYFIDMARAYGQTDAFAIGLILLSPVFMCILGFGDAKYLGVIH